jgi:hypothetical protein
MLSMERYGTSPTAWLETIFITLGAVALAFLGRPGDPFFVGAGFPWLVFAPAVIALRYGVVLGVVSTGLPHRVVVPRQPLWRARGRISQAAFSGDTHPGHGVRAVLQRVADAPAAARIRVPPARRAHRDAHAAPLPHAAFSRPPGAGSDRETDDAPLRVGRGAAADRGGGRAGAARRAATHAAAGPVLPARSRRALSRGSRFDRSPAGRPYRRARTHAFRRSSRARLPGNGRTCPRADADLG